VWSYDSGGRIHRRSPLIRIAGTREAKGGSYDPALGATGTLVSRGGRDEEREVKQMSSVGEKCKKEPFLLPNIGRGHRETEVRPHYSSCALKGSVL